MLQSLRRASAVAAALVLSASASFAATVTVYSNNPAGDDFTNPTGVNTTPLTPGASVSGSGWYYNNVRNNGHVGVNTNYARSGNASVWFQGTQGDPSSSKSDIEMLSATGFGALKDLTSFAYEWIRSSTSPAGTAAASHLHPSLRLFVSNGVQSGYLVYERGYNPSVSPVPTDTWQSDDVFGSNAFLWTTGSLPGAFANYNTTLSQWQDTSSLGNYTVYGISTGIGSGWGTFDGAVDNITFGFNGNNNTYNFETAAVVPLPAAAWMGLSLLGSTGVAGFFRKRRMANAAI